ncbi:MAG TPA: serine/threonine-protein kinase [Nannocystaceae bacterium]|nr:serine/threonine-protein kinase [Nannocystaceae bacterium]
MALEQRASCRHVARAPRIEELGVARHGCDSIVEMSGEPGAAVVDPAEAALLARVGARLFGDEATTRIGRYRLGPELGRGGLGIVYAAHDEELDRPVAFKIIRAEVIAALGLEQMHARLRREARALARLDHPNVVKVFDVGYTDERLWLAMELVDGATLRAWCVGRTWTEIRDALVDAGRGLAAAHAVGLVHRDFKPGNVMVDRSGRARVLDFGLARGDGDLPAAAHTQRDAVADELTRTGTMLGTPRYMAPEQFEGGRVDARTDQWAFSVTAHELIFGAHPFVGGTVDEVRAAVCAGTRAEVPARTRVPAYVVVALARGMAVAPADRFAAMAPLLAALQASPRRLRTIAIALVAAIVIAVVVIARSHASTSDAALADATPLVQVANLRAVWSTPHQIRWEWQVEGEPDALLHYAIWVGPSEASVRARDAQSRRFGPDENPELARFLLPKTSDVERVTATTTDGFEPSTRVFAQLVATDTARRESTSNIAAAVTQEPATHAITIFDEAALAGHSIPPGFELAHEQPHAGEAHLRYVVDCEGAAECWIVLRRTGLAVELPTLTAGNYETTAYLDLAIAVVGATPPWWSELWLWHTDAAHESDADLARLMLYKGFTLRSDGHYHRLEVPLRAFMRHGNPARYEDVARYGVHMLAVSGSWTDGARIYVDDVSVRW